MCERSAFSVLLYRRKGGWKTGVARALKVPINAEGLLVTRLGHMSLPDTNLSQLRALSTPVCHPTCQGKASPLASRDTTALPTGCSLLRRVKVREWVYTSTRARMFLIDLYKDNKSKPEKESGSVMSEMLESERLASREAVSLCFPVVPCGGAWLFGQGRSLW